VKCLFPQSQIKCKQVMITTPAQCWLHSKLDSYLCMGINNSLNWQESLHLPPSSFRLESLARETTPPCLPSFLQTSKPSHNALSHSLKAQISKNFLGMRVCPHSLWAIPAGSTPITTFWIPPKLKTLDRTLLDDVWKLFLRNSNLSAVSQTNLPALNMVTSKLMTGRIMG